MFNSPQSRYLDRISLLDSRDLVARAYHSIHRRELNTAKTTEILAHLSQGKSYQMTAETADEIVRPLLQYYSILAYARAAILLLHPSFRETSLSNSHGLIAIQWKEHLSRGGNWVDSKIRAVTGTFSQFGEVTGNKKIVELLQPTGEYLRLEANGTEKYPDGFEFTVGDILRRMPGLINHYETIMQAPALCWSCSISDHPTPWSIRITSNHLGLPTTSKAAQLLAIDDSNIIKQKETNYMGLGPTHELEVSFEGISPESLIPHLRNIVSISRDPYIVEPFPEDVNLSYPSLLFAFSYALGMLVRYYPTYWMSMMGHGRGDSNLPLLRAAGGDTKTFSSAIAEYL